jgi:AraC-like DNA-binding protein
VSDVSVTSERVRESVWRAPAQPLRPFVSWYTGYRQAGLAPGRHRGLPSPALTFIITLEDPVVIAAHLDRAQPPGSYDTLLGGLHTAPVLVTHDGRQSGVQLALTPLGARALLGMPAAELANWDGDATAVAGQFAADVREHILACDSWAQRFAVLDQLLSRRALPAAAAARGRVRPEVAFAWRRLRSSRGTVSVAELATETGCSVRYLNSLLRAEVGLAPKAAARVFRFDYARRRIAGAADTAATAPVTAAPAPALTLADVAAECGYYDQAHLAREFRELAGCPPTQWLDEEFRFVQAAPAPAMRASQP